LVSLVEIASGVICVVMDGCVRIIVDQGDLNFQL